ncbi:hypothetical protein [Sulfurisphaera ohwakuensis]|uniref:Uncharacterized protein n=1 Tax=Sulfurisphaera ohwakuensis TaxID=69656 RepID=A0A650CHX2_SULOH|nr:hypothetical protein [Sulfurisphaera ohwakuensis]MBB5254680.1 hypothetical protein [Sulfurisphaera ohwakuensis]QGR17328.1 hypothetical protein D1869_09080 [Sulfurisphaera ohwakuensis]
MDDIFKTMIKYGPMQLAIAMIMVGIAINLEPLTIVGSVLLTIMIGFLINDFRKKNSIKKNT